MKSKYLLHITCRVHLLEFEDYIAFLYDKLEPLSLLIFAPTALNDNYDMNKSYSSEWNFPFLSVGLCSWRAYGHWWSIFRKISCRFRAFYDPDNSIIRNVNTTCNFFVALSSHTMNFFWLERKNWEIMRNPLSRNDARKCSVNNTR